MIHFKIWYLSPTQNGLHLRRRSNNLVFHSRQTLMEMCAHCLTFLEPCTLKVIVTGWPRTIWVFAFGLPDTRVCTVFEREPQEYDSTFPSGAVSILFLQGGLIFRWRSNRKSSFLVKWYHYLSKKLRKSCCQRLLYYFLWTRIQVQRYWQLRSSPYCWNHTRNIFSFQVSGFLYYVWQKGKPFHPWQTIEARIRNPQRCHGS